MSSRSSISSTSNDNNRNNEYENSISCADITIVAVITGSIVNIVCPVFPKLFSENIYLPYMQSDNNKETILSINFFLFLYRFFFSFLSMNLLIDNKKRRNARLTGKPLFTTKVMADSRYFIFPSPSKINLTCDCH